MKQIQIGLIVFFTASFNCLSFSHASSNGGITNLDSNTYWEFKNTKISNQLSLDGKWRLEVDKHSEIIEITQMSGCRDLVLVWYEDGSLGHKAETVSLIEEQNLPALWFYLDKTAWGKAMNGKIPYNAARDSFKGQVELEDGSVHTIEITRLPNEKPEVRLSNIDISINLLPNKLDGEIILRDPKQGLVSGKKAIFGKEANNHHYCYTFEFDVLDQLGIIIYSFGVDRNSANNYRAPLPYLQENGLVFFMSTSANYEDGQSPNQFNLVNRKIGSSIEILD